MRNFVSSRIAAVPPSGIRKYFDIVAQMKEVISLGIGEPDFTSPDPILRAGMESLRRGERPRLALERVADLDLLGLLLLADGLGEVEQTVGAVRIIVVSRDSPFRIPNPKYGRDVTILDSDEGTGLFNPLMTLMRVVDSGLDHKFARSAGRRLVEALRQLPSAQDGIIALGEVPTRIAEAVIATRFEERAYDHILAFVVNEIDSSDFHFIYRAEQGPRVQRMVGAGLKPLFAA